MQDKIISNLTWNVSGVLLAVAFSNDIHEGWCNHEASVVLYNLSENKVAKYPQTRVLKTFSCVTSIAFHPYMPTILAGGFHSGTKYFS